MTIVFTPEDVLTLIAKAHKCAVKLRPFYETILTDRGGNPQHQASTSNEEVARDIIATANAYGALAPVAAYFGHDPAPFSLAERLGEVLATSLLVKRPQNVEVSPFWSLEFWTKHSGGTTHPADAIVQLEVDMRRRIAEMASAKHGIQVKSKRSKKKRGCAPVDPGEARKRHNIVAEYKKRKGMSRKEFCEQEGITHAYLKTCLAWDGMRKNRRANKIASSD